MKKSWENLLSSALTGIKESELDEMELACAVKRLSLHPVWLPLPQAISLAERCLSIVNPLPAALRIQCVGSIVARCGALGVLAMSDLELDDILLGEAMDVLESLDRLLSQPGVYDVVRDEAIGSPRRSQISEVVCTSCGRHYHVRDIAELGEDTMYHLTNRIYLNKSFN